MQMINCFVLSRYWYNMWLINKSICNTLNNYYTQNVCIDKLPAKLSPILNTNYYVGHTLYWTHIIRNNIIRVWANDLVGQKYELKLDTAINRKPMEILTLLFNRVSLFTCSTSQETWTSILDSLVMNPWTRVSKRIYMPICHINLEIFHHFQRPASSRLIHKQKYPARWKWVWVSDQKIC